MSKRTSFAGLLGGDEKTEGTPGAPPVSALLHTITGNPDNPRDVNELDLDEMVQSFHEVGQLQPVLVVSREVYLRHKPQHARTIGDAQYVILGGNRRLEAAQSLGWARIDIALRDDLGDGEGSLDEAVIIENIHRKALAPIKEAGFLQAMVDRYGSQVKVAQRIGKTQAYVSQRLALLRLEPELQQAVDAGELKVKDARKLTTAPRAEQRKALDASKASASPPRPSTEPSIPSPAPAPETYNRVIDETPAATGKAASGGPQAGPLERPTGHDEAGGEELPDLPEVITVGAVRWGDPAVVKATARHWMTEDNWRAFRKLVAEND